MKLWLDRDLSKVFKISSRSPGNNGNKGKVLIGDIQRVLCVCVCGREEGEREREGDKERREGRKNQP